MRMGCVHTASHSAQPLCSVEALVQFILPLFTGRTSDSCVQVLASAKGIVFASAVIVGSVFGLPAFPHVYTESLQLRVYVYYSLLGIMLCSL